MSVEEALRRAIARIPASEEGPLTVGLEVDRFGNATATLDFEMTEEQLQRSYAACDALARNYCRVGEICRSPISNRR